MPLAIAMHPLERTQQVTSLYPSRAIRRARVFIEYTLQRPDGFLALSGARGAGKSSLLREVTEYLPVSTRLVQFSAAAFAQASGPHGATEALQRQLREARLAPREGEQSVLLWVDDAQALGEAALGRVMHLAAEARDVDWPMRVIVSGQGLSPRLSDRAGLGQLDTYAPSPLYLELCGLEDAEVAGYLDHWRQSVRVARAPLFRAEVHSLLHEASAGMPGRLASLCDSCLRHARDAGSEWVDEAMVVEVLARMDRQSSAGPVSSASAGARDPRSEALLAAVERLSGVLNECAGLIEHELRSMSEGVRPSR
ncbi:hypothetical protein [Alkalilimnicola sp. S0819]|uniref:hypothetical protein n=1 Tax=Alkalilimnicola sp. S0819 TaxID=2613922 RepID=UPI0012615105|nr:hypothetical protein [Alkalilimnicola sp. S0819]KAB7622845.1 hypothetical protein F3N43_11020 [Alkalilimnicola sp. S0819]MPQ17167.1 hypothetical protein [Alkalilimnicola sp. S0819]